MEKGPHPCVCAVCSSAEWRSFRRAGASPLVSHQALTSPPTACWILLQKPLPPAESPLLHESEACGPDRLFPESVQHLEVVILRYVCDMLLCHFISPPHATTLLCPFLHSFSSHFIFLVLSPHLLPFYAFLPSCFLFISSNLLFHMFLCSFSHLLAGVEVTIRSDGHCCRAVMNMCNSPLHIPT